MITLKEISKSFNANTVIDKLSFTFENGKTYGIIGENGAGKTTLFKCIAGLERYKGTIVSENKPLKNYIGFLQTEPFFYSMMTGLEYLQYINNAKNSNISDFKDQNIFDLPLKNYISTYSTGMKKKLALFSVLLMEVEYFILDEPFNGVDLQSSMLIFEVLDALRAKGKTIIISSHIYSTLTQTCDEICLLENGNFNKCVGKNEFNSLEKLLKKDTVKNALKLRVKNYELRITKKSHSDDHYVTSYEMQWNARH